QSLNDDGPVNDWIVCWPKHLLEPLDPKQIKSWDFWTRPVGCGPYRHVRTVPKTMMEFRASPDYFRGIPKIATVILKFGDNTIPELWSNSVDAVCFPSRSDVGTINRDGRFRAYQTVDDSGWAIYWNNRHPLFQDVTVRRGLTCAINRPELLRFLDLPEGARPV